MDRLDIMVDLETLGTKGDVPIFQISAMCFDITNGKVYTEQFNEIADIKTFDNIQGDTLKWWLNTNAELLKELLNNKTKYNEDELMISFIAWINGLCLHYNIDKENIYLWGNGILFDNKLISTKCEKYSLPYPIKYTNDRDMRTIVELASLKKGCSVWDYRNSIEQAETKHNALCDVEYQIRMVRQAYCDLMGE